MTSSAGATRPSVGTHPEPSKEADGLGGGPLSVELPINLS